MTPQHTPGVEHAAIQTLGLAELALKFEQER
jgi:hypothetical protein